MTEETNYEDITVKVEVPPGEGYLLLPGQLCLGITTEKIKLAPGICGLLGTYDCFLHYSMVKLRAHRYADVCLWCPLPPRIQRAARDSLVWASWFTSLLAS